MDDAELWRLYSVEGLRSRAIAERLGIPRGTVDCHLSRYRKRMGLSILPSRTCRRGHERTPENTRIDRSGRTRCQACEKSYDRCSRSFGEGLHCTVCGKDGHSMRTCQKLNAIPGVDPSRKRCPCGLLMPCYHAPLSELATARTQPVIEERVFEADTSRRRKRAA